MSEFKFTEAGFVVFEVETGSIDTANSWVTFSGNFSHASAYEYILNVKFFNKKNIHIVECTAWKGASTSYLSNIVRKKRLKDCKIIFDVVNLFTGDGTLKQSRKLEFYQIDTGNETVQSLFDEKMTQVGLINEIDNIKVEDACDAHISYDNDSIDFVFFDTWKDPERVLSCLESWFPKVKVNGVIGCENYETYESIKDAVNEFFLDNQDSLKRLNEDVILYSGSLDAKPSWILYERIS